MHVEVFGTSKGTGCAAVCAFHAEGKLCIDPCADFLCEVLPYDDDLRALIKNSSFCLEVVYEYVNLTQGERVLSFAFGKESKHGDWVCTIGIGGLLKGVSFNTARAE